jgi:hypothetical protein
VLGLEVELGPAQNWVTKMVQGLSSGLELKTLTWAKILPGLVQRHATVTENNNKNLGQNSPLPPGPNLVQISLHRWLAINDCLHVSPDKNASPAATLWTLVHSHLPHFLIYATRERIEDEWRPSVEMETAAYRQWLSGSAAPTPFAGARTHLKPSALPSSGLVAAFKLGPGAANHQWAPMSGDKAATVWRSPSQTMTSMVTVDPAVAAVTAMAGYPTRWRPILFPDGYYLSTGERR